MEIKFIDYLQYNSYVTLTMFFLSFAILIIDKITFGAANKYVFSSGRSSLLNPLTYINLFTHILGHNDWGHFANNYMKILLLGPLIEEKYGWLNFLIMILFTALITGVLNFITNRGRIRGASGIVFMLIVLSAFSNVIERKIPITFLLVILFYLVDEIKMLPKKDNIAHDAHLIGGICGAVFGFLCINQNLINLLMNLKEQILG